MEGKLACQSVELEIPTSGAKSSAALGQKQIPHVLRSRQKRATFIFAQPLQMLEGDQLQLEA